jgi:hypothetical protein
VNLGVTRDLTIKTLTGLTPSSVVVKVLATLAGANGSGDSTACKNSAAAPGTPVSGMVAWGTTLHTQGTGYVTTETPFVPATLSTTASGFGLNNELSSISGRCAAILGNGSGYGVCLSCRSGSLGATKK